MHYSYLSVIELGLYDSSVKLFRQLTERGVLPLSEEWNREIEETMERQRQAMHPRAVSQDPRTAGISAFFIPWTASAAKEKNWYMLPIEERQRQMEEHGTVGRRYAGRVQQIITGSVGFDDWEWGVDLFAPEPMVFKKLDLRDALLTRSARSMRHSVSSSLVCAVHSRNWESGWELAAEATSN